jgi:hypothetical protein
MAVAIHDLSKDEVYIAHNESDCLDETDKSAYQEVVKFNCIVTMGCVIAEPL